MPLTAAQRMARMRTRQSASGLITVTLVVPAQDTQQFYRLAANRRKTLLRDRSLTQLRSVLGQRMQHAVASSRINSSDIMETRALLEVAAVELGFWCIQGLWPTFTRWVPKRGGHARRENPNNLLIPNRDDSSGPSKPP